MRRFHLWLTVVLGCLCGLLAYRLLRQQQDLTRARVDLAARTATEKSIRQENTQLKTTVAAQASVAKAATRAAAQARGTVGAGAAGGSSNLIRMSDVIKDHPEMAAIRDREMRRNIMRSYGAAMASLDLPPDKLAQLKNLLVEQQLGQTDAREAAEAAGLPQGSAQWMQAMIQVQRQSHEDIVAAIGGDAYAKLEQGMQVATYQSQVQSTYALDFEDAGTPITPEQSQNLAQVMYNVQSFTANPDARTPGYRQMDPDTGLSPSDQEILTRAAELLSAPQVEVLKADLKNRNVQNEVMQPYYRRAGGNTIITN